MKWWPFRQRDKRREGGNGESLPAESFAGAANGAIGELAQFFGLANAPRIAARPAVAPGAPSGETISRPRGLRPLPQPALRWVGPAGRIALREFSFEADAEEVCAFQEETYTLNFPEFHYSRSFAQAFRHDLRRATLDHQHGLFVLDERTGGQDTLAGFLWLLACENNWTGERYGYINNVYIAPSRRGQGLGADLMRHTDDFFRARGVHRVRLTVTASNQAAASLYEHSGYCVTRWEMEKEL